MNNSNAAESPLEAAADIAGGETTQAFSLLGNETRLAVLLTLWEDIEPVADGEWQPRGEPMPFTELHERVGEPDPDQFNYHLSKLEGEFIERSSDGYQLLPTGTRIVRAIIGVTGLEEETLAPTEIGLDCPLCEAPTAVSFRDKRLYQFCTECDGYYDLGEEHPSGLLGMWGSMSAPAIRKREPRDIHDSARIRIHHHFAQASAGICSNCSGPVEGRLTVCADHNPASGETCSECGRSYEVAAFGVCRVCKSAPGGAISHYALRHPSVVAFYWKHGIELGHDREETSRLAAHVLEDADEELLSRDPLRVRVVFHHDDDEVQLTYDEEMNVVEVNENF